jgi:cytochrome b561
VTHGGLYALLLVRPFVGWIATSAYPASVTVFGWLELPPIWFKNRELSDQLFSLHRWIGVAIAALVIAHASPLHEDGHPPAQFVTLSA